jgi:hypothetical protein
MRPSSTFTSNDRVPITECLCGNDIYEGDDYVTTKKVGHTKTYHCSWPCAAKYIESLKTVVYKESP